MQLCGQLILFSDFTFGNPDTAGDMDRTTLLPSATLGGKTGLLADGQIYPTGLFAIWHQQAIGQQALFAKSGKKTPVGIDNCISATTITLIDEPHVFQPSGIAEVQVIVGVVEGLQTADG